jgi:hypothetical protein
MLFLKMCELLATVSIDRDCQVIIHAPDIADAALKSKGNSENGSLAFFMSTCLSFIYFQDEYAPLILHPNATATSK